MFNFSPLAYSPATLQWFYLNEVVFKYAKSILAYTENKLKEYKRIRSIRQEYFAMYRENADRHKTEDISAIALPIPKKFQTLNQLSRRDRMSE